VFVDRVEELRVLEELYARGGAQLVVVYGRRRIGKTWLVKKFLEEKRGVYIYAMRQPLSVEVARLAEALSAVLGRYVRPEWGAVFEALASAGRFVLAIDEFTHWVEANSAAVSTLQWGWDEYLSNSEVFLVLLSSTVSLVEKAFSYGGGLYGRRSAQLKLGPLEPQYTGLFLPGYSPEDLAIAYAVSNGVPYYLSLFRADRPLEENIAFLFSKWGPLYDEAENLLRYEVREPHVYFNIVRAIEEGTSTYSEIADRAKVKAATLSKYLAVLEKLDVVKREVPLLSKARPVYRVVDLYIKFWISSVYPQREWIELGESPRVDLRKYMGQAYEEVVRRAIPHLAKIGRIPPVEKCGRYWEKGVEVDIVCLSGDRVVAVEVKWGDVDEGEALEIVRETKKKLGGREGVYLVAARRGPRGGHVITAEDIFAPR